MFRCECLAQREMVEARVGLQVSSPIVVVQQPAIGFAGLLILLINNIASFIREIPWGHSEGEVRLGRAL